MKNANMPAAPQSVSVGIDGSLVGSYMEDEWQGLTKREMFAMHSMQAILSGNSLRELGDIAKENGLDNADSFIVEMSISAADALLAELGK